MAEYLTQGTELYFIDPLDNTVKNVGCFTSLDGISATRDQIDVTCMPDQARRYRPGLITPGSATFSINIDPQNPVHLRLHELEVAGTTLEWAVGWSDNTGVAPTAAIDSDGSYEFVLPETRTWLLFEGYMNDFPFSFAQNDVVKSNLGVQISGETILIPRVAS